MLPEPLRRYLADVESAIRSLRRAHVEHYQEEILTSERVNLRVRIRFSRGFLLELNEALVLEAGIISHLGYRYHFQDGQNRLLFRYDNTPHFPDLQNFPHHLHVENGVEGCERPPVTEVIEKAMMHVSQGSDSEMV